MTLGTRLELARQLYEATQQQLADRSKVEVKLLRHIEQHAIRPDALTLRRLADALHIREAWLADGEEPMLSLANMTVDEQHRCQSGPGTEGLPGYVIVGPGPWYRDGDTWRVVGVKKGTSRK